MKRPIVYVAGTGRGLPEKVLRNEDFVGMGLDTSDEWITSRTGIKERRISGPDDTTCSLGAEAARRAMAKAGVTAGELDAIVVSTATPDRLLPSTAVDLQAELGATRAAASRTDAAGRKSASTSCVDDRAPYARHITAPPTRNISAGVPVWRKSSLSISSSRRISALVRGCTCQTRSPIVASMNRFRRRKGGGEWVSRCSRRIINTDPKTGSGSGATARTQPGTRTERRSQACSIMAAM